MWFAVVAGVLLGSGVSVQGPSPSEIADQADRALRQLERFTCQVTLLRQTQPARGGEPTIDSLDHLDVAAERHSGEDRMGWRVRMVPREGGKNPLNLPGVYAYDGSTSTEVIHAHRSVSIVTDSEQRDLFFLVFPGAFKRVDASGKVRNDPFSATLKAAATVENLPGQTVGGVPCVGFRKVEQPQPQAGMESQLTDFWFGKEDLLLRRIEVVAVIGGTRFNQVLTLSNFSKDPTIDPGAFRPPAPSGYRVHRRTYADLVAEQLRTAKESQKKRDEDAQFLKPGKPAPDFVLSSTGSWPFTLSKKRGQVVLLDFFGTWCAPCNMAMPGHQKLFESLATKGLILVGISCREQAGVDVGKYMRDRGFSYPVLVQGDPVAERYHVNVYPTVVVVDRKGTIAYVAYGHSEKIAREIEEALEKAIAN